MSASDADILAAVRAWFGPQPPARLAIALSGGGDSVALLHILSRAFEPRQVRLAAATVDHGLRADAAQEAAAAARQAAALGVPHAILRWRGWDGQGNLQDAARTARYDLLSDWALGQGIGALAVAHTADDQAETLLMRLGRAAGVTGLAGIPPRRLRGAVMILRPLLGIGRDDLRAYLRRNGLEWSEDPSNLDTKFTRVRAREALSGLADLGVTPAALTHVARNMVRAEEALGWAAFEAARTAARVAAGCVVLDPRALRLMPDEIARRLLVGALAWVGGGGYPPRRRPVAALLADLHRGQGATLAGCRVLEHRGEIWICREVNALHDIRVAPGGIWDRRWRLSGPGAQGCEIRALGAAGLAHCPERAATGAPRAALEASPAVWREGDLIAAPLAGRAAGWRAEPAEDGPAFPATLLSH
ncbi:tRNA lysidine(34) synthetase TilS [Antarcticimicrobium luteum]|uniref:tRNA(Ile)-lysidine synthase n=1 Tax=Antarcticimicrobium luteum TaxID=2547397 RepID=A0A4R5V7M7_9RHOB|nr:tRNA lysidine(34) synthetase TilS [Antarcticimicrobium luteum]TDK48019.1 tRNA lysidine(34) synthetase TilS [Antarcticimicrobium luteum]